jgi:hypothetical protein
LDEHFEELKANIGGDLSLPTLSEIYGLMSVKSKINENVALFVFRLPLLSSTEYDVIQMVPVPVQLNQIYMEIQASTEIIMVNKHRDVVYTLSKAEFDLCMKPEDRRFICRLDRPYYTRIATNLQCEFSILKDEVISKQCHMTLFPPKAMWIQLYQQNHWLFSLQVSKTYTMVCDGETYRIKLNRSGVLSLYGDCALREEGVTEITQDGNYTT